MPIFKIQHTTTYQYNAPVQESVNAIRIFAYQHAAQEILQHDLYITDSPEILFYHDYWGNKTGVFNLLSPHKELVIDSKLTVRTTAMDTIELPSAGFDSLKIQTEGKLPLLELSKPDLIASSSALFDIVNTIYHQDDSVPSIVHHCCQFIFQNFQYIKGITSIETTLDEILEKRAGVCQDFAHIMLQILRSLGIPSRYVSGYICPNKNGLRGEGATHAWVEAWIPSYGWAGIDPTNNVWVTNNHVKLAVGRNFNDCSPVKGSFKGLAKQNLSVFVSVGYEDGHVFEERNNVKLKHQPDFAEQQIIDFAQQQ